MESHQWSDSLGDLCRNRNELQSDSAVYPDQHHVVMLLSDPLPHGESRASPRGRGSLTPYDPHA